MDVRQLEYLLTVAQEGSLSAAAEVIHISQSALSQNLLKIEKQLGTPLFIRTEKKMIPTEAGARYLAGAKAIVDIKKDTYEKIEKLIHEKENVVSLAICPQVYQHSGHKILHTLREAFGSAGVTLQELNSETAREYLMNDLVDAAILCDDGKPESLLTIHDLYTEEIVLAVPKEMAWEGTAVDPSALKKCPFALAQGNSYLISLIEPLTADPAFTASISYRVESLQNVRTLVENGYAASFVPGRIASIMQGCRLYNWYTAPGYQIAFAMSKFTGKRKQLQQMQEAIETVLR